ncbi:MAG TPA: nucleotidyltransferase domain-containing protein, partial [Thermoprotei archaeon]|nr:nucleotidyltransferase domain-containing protein [Thermoprotei archaeon]
VSNSIPEKIDFEWYCKIVKALTDDYRINIHLLSKKRLKEYEKIYSPMIKVEISS